MFGGGRDVFQMPDSNLLSMAVAHSRARGTTAVTPEVARVRNMDV